MIKKFEENYEYGICNPQDKELIIEMADCLAETFAGVKVGNAVIKEPMSIAINLTKESLTEFVQMFIENASADGLCTYARDKSTGRIVGALASENFNPDEEAPVFEGALQPINLITEFLGRLDKRFIETVKLKTNKQMRKNEYVHSLMLGVRTEKDKKYIGANLIQVMMDSAKEKKYKGVFGEATNYRSQKLIDNFFGWYTVSDINGQPISLRYEDDKIFNSIPKDVATECCLMYKPFDEKFRL